jgi:hypothetical protein
MYNMTNDIGHFGKGFWSDQENKVESFDIDGDPLFPLSYKLMREPTALVEEDDIDEGNGEAGTYAATSTKRKKTPKDRKVHVKGGLVHLQSMDSN